MTDLPAPPRIPDPAPLSTSGWVQARLADAARVLHDAGAVPVRADVACPLGINLALFRAWQARIGVAQALLDVDGHLLEVTFLTPEATTAGVFHVRVHAACPDPALPLSSSGWGAVPDPGVDPARVHYFHALLDTGLDPADAAEQSGLHPDR